MSGTDQTICTRLDNIEMTPPADLSGGVHDTIDISEHSVVVHIVSTKQAVRAQVMGICTNISTR